MRYSLLVVLLCWLQHAHALVGFVNQNSQLVILDIKKRRIVKRFDNKSIVAYFKTKSRERGVKYFDMKDWREMTSIAKPDYIRSQKWGDKYYILYSDRLVIADDGDTLTWNPILSKALDLQYSDFLVHNDSLMIFADKATVHASLCSEEDTAQLTSGGVEYVIPYEPYFFLRKYKDKLSISSIFHPLQEFFVTHELEEVIDFIQSDLLYIATPYTLYSINPVYRKLHIVLETRPYLRFAQVIAWEDKLYLLISDNSIVCYDIGAEEVTAITYVEGTPSSIGVDQNLIYAAVGSEIYCFQPHNLEVSHILSLNADSIKTPVLTYLNL